MLALLLCLPGEFNHTEKDSNLLVDRGRPCKSS